MALSAPAPVPVRRFATAGGRTALRRAQARRFVRRPAAVVGLALTVLVVMVALLHGRLAPNDPFKPVGRPKAPPSAVHLMGTDHLGRDVLSGVIVGAHTSLRVVGWVTVMTLGLGLGAGVLAGYRRGWVDDAIMRLAELVQSVPRFFLAILVVTWLGRGLDNLILLLGLTSWPLLARIVRSQVLAVRQTEFVSASLSSGASSIRVVARHILPQVMPAAVVVLSVTASRVILLEASLSFLGLTDPNLMSWGALINNAQNYLRDAWWMSVFPGLAIATAAIGLNLLSDGLNDVLNPLLSSADDPDASRLAR